MGTSDDKDRRIIELEKEVSDRELFIGILAHDLRNMLSVIGMATSALNRSSVQETTRIVNNLARINKLIEQTLDFTRMKIDEGIPIVRVGCNAGLLTGLVVSDMNLLQAQAEQIRFQAAGDLNGLWDASRLQQVVMNLLINAITHGKPPISVWAYKDGDAAVITVSNAGPPIDPKIMETIFLPFARVRTTSQSGLGLGLFIVEQIVKAHGGTVEVESSGDGTTFTVTLPIS